ncbi:putative F-box domain-containing protein [Tanacetum coccineum]
MSDNIPFEIQTEIIKRLPVKSLRDAFGYNYVSYVDNHTFPHQKVSLTLPTSVLNLTKPLLVGSSQGLFCFYNFFQAKTAIIWNPTIRKSVDVVVPKALDGRSYSTVVGFVVCPRTLDPMLVKISTESGSLIEYLKNTTWAVEVFRLSSGVWKSLCVDLPWSIAVKWNQVVIDKFIYWHAFERISGYDLIISFDMISEEFNEIRLPDSILGVHVGTGIELFICKLKESLVVLQCDCEYDFCRYLAVWMMDNGDPKSFENIYTIKSNIPDALISTVRAFNRNGEAVVEMTKELDEEDEYELFVYEPNSQHVNHLGISAKGSSFFVSSYTETLLLLDH